MCEAKRQKHFTHKFSVSVSGSACSNGCDTLSLLSVTQYMFPFKKDVLCVTKVVQLFLHLCFNIMKLKYKCCRCFHGNQLFKCRGMSKYKFSYFQKHALRSYSNCGGKFDKLN